MHWSAHEGHMHWGVLVTLIVLLTRRHARCAAHENGSVSPLRTRTHLRDSCHAL